uniref:Uncharacterized protein n=1 Tax=Arundo donax TaxID=35708 RepID=A0A0A8ZSC7_ARUDO
MLDQFSPKRGNLFGSLLSARECLCD